MEHSKQISHVYQTLNHWLTFGDNIVINISLGQINHMLLQLITMEKEGLLGMALCCILAMPNQFVPNNKIYEQKL